MDMGAYGIVPDGRDVGPGLMRAMAEERQVTLEKGVYMTSPIAIPSGTVLEIKEGAVLKLIPDFSLYEPVYTRWEGVQCWCLHPCIFINEAEDVTLKGPGCIDGSGPAWWKTANVRRKAEKPETELELRLAALNPDYKEMPGGGGGRQVQFLRPPLLQIRESRNVRVENLFLTESPFWTVHVLFSEGVVLDGLRISNPDDAPNTDGIDIESSFHVCVSNTEVSVGDDGIAVKSGSGIQGIRENRPCGNILIKGCLVHASHGGAVIGSETAADISHVTVEDCVFNGTDRGIRIKTRRGRGGHIHGLVFRNLEMKNNLTPFAVNSYYNCGDPSPELYSLDPMPVTSTTPRIENVVVEGCRATGCRASAGMLTGLPELPVKNVLLKDCVFEVAEDASVPVSETDMFQGLPVPSTRGFRIRYAKVRLENFHVVSDGEPVIVEEGADIKIC